jgi:hypothetical protein
VFEIVEDMIISPVAAGASLSASGPAPDASAATN